MHKDYMISRLFPAFVLFFGQDSGRRYFTAGTTNTDINSALLRPELNAPWARQRFSFSVSHSGEARLGKGHGKNGESHVAELFCNQKGTLSVPTYLSPHFVRKNVTSTEFMLMNL